MADGTQRSGERPSAAGEPPSAGLTRTLPSLPPATVSGQRLRAPSRPHGHSVELGLARTLATGQRAATLTDLAQAPEPLSVGDVVGERYVIEEHISSGGFGAVYRASDRQIRNHQVALKLLHTPAADEAARASAMRELTLIASVSHPSVVQFKDYGWHAGRLWFAMPWYRGQTLAQRYAGTAMTRAEARPIFERLALGLAAMHQVGIEHHDIKPENIFLADIAGFEGGLPVLLDLGIAGEQGEGPRGLTLDYAAPETARQALGEDVAVGPSADVFSLALVLRNMLEPRELSPEAQEDFSPLSLLHQRATQPVEGFEHRSLRYLQPSLMRWLDADPDARPSAAQLAAELSVLTEPEERRAARVRLLKRLVPVVLVAALLVSALWLQVRRQQSEISAQRERLSEQLQQTALLRERTESQLGQLENQMAEIGNKRRELTRAIEIARELDQQLERTEQQREQLSRKARGLTSERDGLLQELADRDKEYHALQVARDALQAQHQAVSAERDSLRSQRDALSVERAQLSEQAASLSAEVEQGRLQLGQLEAERDRALEQQRLLENEAAALRQQRDSQERARSELVARVERLEADKAALEQRQTLAAQTPPQTPPQTTQLPAAPVAPRVVPAPELRRVDPEAARRALQRRKRP